MFIRDDSQRSFAILSDYLIPRKFTESGEYFDQLGGRVIDYFLDKSRITCIVSHDQVQILSYLEEKIRDKVIYLSDNTENNISEYLDCLFDDSDV